MVIRNYFDLDITVCRKNTEICGFSNSTIFGNKYTTTNKEPPRYFVGSNPKTAIFLDPF